MPTSAGTAVAKVGIPEMRGKYSREEVSVIFERLYPKIFSVCLGILHDENAAREATQESFLKGWRKLEGFRGDAKMGTWLIRIAVNTARMSLRGPAIKHPEQFEEYHNSDRAVLSTAELIPGNLLDQNRELAAAEFRKCFDKGLGFLGPKFRAVVYARLVLGMSHDEMAHYFRMSVPAIKSRIMRGRNEIQQFLQEAGYRGSDDLL